MAQPVLDAPPEACPVCLSTDARELYRFEPARWIPGTVVRCRACGTIFKRLAASAKPLAEYYDASYAALEYWDTEQATRTALEPILETAVQYAPPAGAALLDVGCGPGAFLTMAAEAGYRTTGVELNPLLAARASRRSGAEVIVGGIESAHLEGRRFDIVTMLDLIEHLADPVAALRRVAGLLAPGGCVLLYTPNHAGLVVKAARALFALSRGRIRRPVDELFDCLHVVFFDRRTLAMAVTRAGLDVAATRMLPYDPGRSMVARGAAALVLRGLEAASAVVGGQFRILMVAAAHASAES